MYYTNSKRWTCQKRGKYITAFYFVKNNNNYTLFIEIPDYIVKSENKFYHLRGTKVGKDIVINGGKVSSPGRAFVYNDPEYGHPFISGGTNKEQICYGGGNDISYQKKF